MANGLTERVAPVGEAAILMGIELSKKGWLVALRDPLRTEYRFAVYRRATQKVFLLWLNGRG